MTTEDSNLYLSSFVQEKLATEVWTFSTCLTHQQHRLQGFL